jgi:hypothetical protein
VLTFRHGRWLQIQNTFVKITGAPHIGDRVTAKREFDDFHDLLWLQSLHSLRSRPKGNSRPVLSSGPGVTIGQVADPD